MAPSENMTSRDRLSLLPVGVGFALAHVVYLLFDQFLDDSVSSGAYITFVVWPLMGITTLVWLGYSARLIAKKERRVLGVPWLIGAAAGAGLTLVMTHIGLPPWRVWFELARPYYSARVWAARLGEADKRVVFTQLDKELWSGRERRLIIYDDDPRRKVDETTMPCRNTANGGEWTKVTKLGFGFYAKQILTSYSEDCPPIRD